MASRLSPGLNRSEPAVNCRSLDLWRSNSSSSPAAQPGESPSVRAAEANLCLGISSDRLRTCRMFANPRRCWCAIPLGMAPFRSREPTYGEAPQSRFRVCADRGQAKRIGGRKPGSGSTGRGRSCGTTKSTSTSGGSRSGSTAATVCSTGLRLLRSSGLHQIVARAHRREV